MIWERQFKNHKKYETFCTFPSHINYQREINNFYNKYEPLSYCVSEK